MRPVWSTMYVRSDLFPAVLSSSGDTSPVKTGVNLTSIALGGIGFGIGSARGPVWLAAGRTANRARSENGIRAFLFVIGDSFRNAAAPRDSIHKATEL